MKTSISKEANTSRRRKAKSARRRKTLSKAAPIPDLTVGVDLGDKRHALCAIDAAGEIVDERNIVNGKEALKRLSKRHAGARIVMEAGSHSPWISRYLEELGHEVVVANPRKLRAIYQNERKSDELDAMMLARLGRVDVKLLHPIRHGTEDAQRDLLMIRLRDTLVRQRVNVISSVRFVLKSLGVRLESPNTKCFAKRARARLNRKIGDREIIQNPGTGVATQAARP